MKTGHFFVQNLGHQVNVDVILFPPLPQLELGQHLVGERGAHDEAGVTGGTTQVDQTALGQNDDRAARGFEGVAFNRTNLRRLDFVFGHPASSNFFFQPGDVDLGVEVPDVAKNGIFSHFQHVVAKDDVAVAGGSDEQIALFGGSFHGGHFETFHRGLQGVDRIDLGDNDAAAIAL